jgi:hypothetical protein
MNRRIASRQYLLFCNGTVIVIMQKPTMNALARVSFRLATELQG